MSEDILKVIGAKDVQDFKLNVMEEELEDLAYDVECLKHLMDALKEGLFYNKKASYDERAGYAIFDLISWYVSEKSGEIDDVATQLRNLKKAGDEE